jgi:hypothetical protein
MTLQIMVTTGDVWPSLGLWHHKSSQLPHTLRSTPKDTSFTRGTFADVAPDSAGLGSTWWRFCMALWLWPIAERGQKRLMRYPASTHDHHRSTQGSGNDHHKSGQLAHVQLVCFSMTPQIFGTTAWTQALWTLVTF